MKNSKTKSPKKKITPKKKTQVTKQTQNNDKYFGVIIISLVIIILILLYFLKFGKINNEKIPTGNVDVFDIDINCGCDEKPIIPPFNESTDKEIFGKVFIGDKEGNYIYQQNLNIFNNSAFEYTNKIAPGVGNTYQFVIHNSMNKKVKYYLKLYEETKYDINMKYRLRKNNKYVIGNENKWVSAEEFQTSYYKINALSSDKYSLDWKWFDNDKQDTFVGKNMKEEYKLNVRFYFELVEEK